VSENLRPTTPQELKELIAAAAAEQTALEILGAGSKRALGRPVEVARRLHLGGLAGVSLYEPAELVMAAQAGTPLVEIEERLAASQLQLDFEPPDYGLLLGGRAGGGTIGGAFACNLAGPRRIKAGAARDHLLGVQAATGRGELIKSGGRVVKNVTGYDLCKLLTGSFGTLAVMSEVTFKVLPAPPETCTLLLSGLPRERAFAALRRALGSPFDVAGAAHLPAAAAARSATVVATAGADVSALRLEGLAPSVRYRAEALTRLLAPEGGAVEQLDTGSSLALWREIRDVALLPGELTLWRVSSAPRAAAELLDALEPRFELAWLADWAGGLLWLAVPDEARGGPADGGAAVIRAALAGPRGHATLIRGSPALRAAVPVFQPQEAALARLTARVKESFDPRRILNPGRMYAGV